MTALKHFLRETARKVAGFNYNTILLMYLFYAVYYLLHVYFLGQGEYCTKIVVGHFYDF